MSDADFLRWIADRLVNVYHESPRTDFVTKLQGIAAAMEDAAMTHQHWCETQRPYSGDVKPGCTCQPTPPSLREQVEQVRKQIEAAYPDAQLGAWMTDPLANILTTFALAQRREAGEENARLRQALYTANKLYAELADEYAKAALKWADEREATGG